MVFRRPDLFKSSPANVRFAGVAILPIVAVLSMVVMAGLTYVVLTYPQLGISAPWVGFAFMGSLIVIGLVIYGISRIIRTQQGINLDLIYRELPPE